MKKLYLNWTIFHLLFQGRLEIHQLLQLESMIKVILGHAPPKNHFYYSLNVYPSGYTLL